MDNMTGKGTAVLIIDAICTMIHISGYFTYLAMVWSHCSRIKEGPLYMELTFTQKVNQKFNEHPLLKCIAAYKFTQA